MQSSRCFETLCDRPSLAAALGVVDEAPVGAEMIGVIATVAAQDGQGPLEVDPGLIPALHPA